MGVDRRERRCLRGEPHYSNQRPLRGSQGTFYSRCNAVALRDNGASSDRKYFKGGGILSGGFSHFLLPRIILFPVISVCFYIGA